MGAFTIDQLIGLVTGGPLHPYDRYDDQIAAQDMVWSALRDRVGVTVW